jgi:hypothetical protein
VGTAEALADMVAADTADRIQVAKWPGWATAEVRRCCARGGAHWAQLFLQSYLYKAAGGLFLRLGVGQSFP